MLLKILPSIISIFFIIIDYVITNSSQSISKDDLEYLSKCCSKSMYLVDNEISKYNIFSSSDQKNIFSNLKASNQFTNLYNKTIFDFTNALLDRDINKIIEFYRDLDKYDFDSIPIISIMDSIIIQQKVIQAYHLSRYIG